MKTMSKTKNRLRYWVAAQHFLLPYYVGCVILAELITILKVFG